MMSETAGNLWKPDDNKDADVIAAVRGVLCDAMRGREIGGDRSLVGMVKRLVAERDEARDNRRGEFELRMEAEAQLASGAPLRTAEGKSAEWARDNCHMLARREIRRLQRELTENGGTGMTAVTVAIGTWQHIIRMCEKAGYQPTGVLREAAPQRNAEGWRPDKEEEMTTNCPQSPELSRYLDQLAITSENIGDVRRRLMMPWDCAWNGIVRDETAKRENKAPRSAPGMHATAGGEVNETLGYIVLQGGSALRLDGEGILRYGSRELVTIFSTRQQVDEALGRTRAYYDTHRIGPVGAYRIARLVATPPQEEP